MRLLVLNRDRQLTMLLHWTTELLTAALSGLDAKQRAALDLLSSTRTDTNPGPVRLKQQGFENRDDYETALATARAHVLAFFRLRGIQHVHDLPFPDGRKSNEGRIQESARKTRTEKSGSADVDTSGDC